MQLVSPSLLVVFWAVSYTTVFFRFEYQPVQQVVDTFEGVLIFAVIICVAIFVWFVEGSRGTPDGNVESGSEKSTAWQSPQWFKPVGFFCIFVSVTLLILICGIVAVSGARTILGWEQAVGNVFPEFGKVLLHLKQIAIPFIVLTCKRLSKGVVLLLLIYFFTSVIYSVAMGERVFFLETTVLLLISSMLRGWIRLSASKIAVAALVFVSFFFFVEIAKQQIYSEAQEGDLFGSFTWMSAALAERLLAYYADPAAKLQFALSEGAFFSDSLWFKDSVGRYLMRAGLALEFPQGINVPYWSSGYGGRILTNSGGLTTLFVDFGLFMFVPLGLYLGGFIWTYRLAARKCLVGGCAYLLFVLAATEMPRVAYIYWARFWMPLLLLTICYIVARRVGSATPVRESYLS